MMADKQLNRIEAKLDALLEKAGIKPESVIKAPSAPKPVPLTDAEQEAIDNAPKPSPVTGPANKQRTDPITNAPVVPAGASASHGAQRRSERREI